MKTKIIFLTVFFILTFTFLIFRGTKSKILKSFVIENAEALANDQESNFTTQRRVVMCEGDGSVYCPATEKNAYSVYVTKLSNKKYYHKQSNISVKSIYIEDIFENIDNEKNETDNDDIEIKIIREGIK